MTAVEIRELVRARLSTLDYTPYHAAGLAGIPAQTLRDYLAGRDMRSTSLLPLLAALGLRIDLDPDYEAIPARSAGRPSRSVK